MKATEMRKLSQCTGCPDVALAVRTRVERRLGNNLLCGHSLEWDISNINTIANTKLRFKLSLFKECILINDILGSWDRGVANTH